MVRGLMDVMISSPIIAFMSVPLKHCKKPGTSPIIPRLLLGSVAFLRPGLGLGASVAEVLLIPAVLPIPAVISISEQSQQKTCLFGVFWGN